MQVIGALAIGIFADLVIAVCLALFVHLDRQYQAEKLAWMQAEGLYRPFVDDDE